MSRPQSVAMSYSPPPPMEFELEETSYTADKTGVRRAVDCSGTCGKVKTVPRKPLKGKPVIL